MSTDTQETSMTSAVLEVNDDEARDHAPRRVLLVTLGVLLPADFEYADVADIIPAGLVVEGFADQTLTDLIQTRVQEARLVMT